MFIHQLYCHLALCSQAVLRAHRTFLDSVSRLSMLDNVTVQESIERVLQVCLRFVAYCRLMVQQEDQIYGFSRVVTSPVGQSGGRSGFDLGNDDGDNDYDDSDAYAGILTLNEKMTTPGSKSRRSASRSSTQSSVPIILPQEELDAIQKEFFTQVSYLFQIMRKVENRGFMFRLDFNGYLSSLFAGMSTNLSNH